MYRVYDRDKGAWVREDVMLARNDKAYTAEKARFSTNKFWLYMMPGGRYEFQFATGLLDREGRPIYEGDVVEAGGGVGVVAYIREKAAFMYLDYTESKYYPLSEYACANLMKVVGNRFDDGGMLPEPEAGGRGSGAGGSGSVEGRRGGVDGEQALSEGAL